MRPPRIAAIRNSENMRLLARVLGESFRPNWRAYAKGFAFLAIVSATTAFTAWIMRDLVNEVFVARQMDMLWAIAAAIFGVFALKGYAMYMQATILARVGNRIVAANQQRIYDHLLAMDLGFFARSASSDLVTRVSYGANAARAVVELLVQSLGRDLLTLVGLVAVMVAQAPLMSLLAFATGPLAIYGVMYLGRRIRGLAKSEMLSTAQIVAVLQETTHGARMVKAFGLEPVMRARMDGAVRTVEARANKIASLQARTGPLMETLSGFAIAAVIVVAGWQTVYYDGTPGAFMSFLTALLLAYEPAKRLSRFHVELERHLVGLRMMFEVLDTEAGPTEIDSGPALRVDAGRIVFRDVGFAYHEGIPVAQDISFVAESGQKVALVGPSGGGKSTVLGMVPRFYDPDRGAVLIDDQDISGVSVASLRAAIAFVSQETYLFSGTVRDNIRLGRPAASDEEVERAARDAHADDFIRALPHGYDSEVGENGVQLSGGQRQRVAIARALLKDAPIILLDEATSALDSETERAIQAALGRLTSGRTTLAIAHRLSTVIDADRILVMQAGRIVESGTHQELLRRGGLYERLSRLQFAETGEAEPA